MAALIPAQLGQTVNGLQYLVHSIRIQNAGALMTFRVLAANLAGTKKQLLGLQQIVPIKNFSTAPSGIGALDKTKTDNEEKRPQGSPVDIPGTRVAAPGDFMVAMFTCKVCETRTARTISKTSYTRGTVLVRCPGCLNSHVLADHLGFFDDHTVTAEQLLQEKGEVVRRGSLTAVQDGDVHAVNLTEADLRVLRSRAGSVRPDGMEPAVAPMQNILQTPRTDAGAKHGKSSGVSEESTTPLK